MARPGDFNVSAVLRAASGQPFTPERETGFGGALETNSGRKPASFLVDLRSEKSLRRGSPLLKAFARVINVLDNRFFNGVVFANSGSPYYSRTQTLGDRKQLSDPGRYYPPRRIELGIQWEGGTP